MSSLFLLSEVHASKIADARSLAEIVATCAGDIGVTVQTHARAPRRHTGPATITLHLPAEFAAEQHPAWCLACRLACFCPDSRVSVLVHSEAAFQRALRRQHVVRVV